MDRAFTALTAAVACSVVLSAAPLVVRTTDTWAAACARSQHPNTACSSKKKHYEMPLCFSWRNSATILTHSFHLLFKAHHFTCMYPVTHEATNIIFSEFMTLNVVKKSCPHPQYKGMKMKGGRTPLIFDLDTNQLHGWAFFFDGIHTLCLESTNKIEQWYVRHNYFIVLYHRLHDLYIGRNM